MALPHIFVIDDDVLIQRALTRLLKAAGYVAEPYSSAQEFLDSGRSQVFPACVIADIEMPGIGGVELQRKLHESNPVMPVVFLTGHGDIPTTVVAMKAGAIDFLTKPVPAITLLTAVATALERAERAGKVQIELDEISQRFSTLTAREREVMEHVVAGFLNKQIAGELGTSEKTVKVHRARGMRKMHTRTLADLVRLLAKLGIPRKVALPTAVPD